MNISSSAKAQIKIISSMYIAYGAIMVLRQMVTILGPALLADQSLGLTKTHLGDFAAYGTIGALVGKVFWGPIADKIGGRLTFLIGITVTALLVIAFGMSANILNFTVFSVLIYGMKSGGWPSLSRLIGNWFHPKRYGSVWSLISTSSRASVVAGTLFFGWLLSFLSWQTVAFISAAIALIICCICFFTMQERPSDEDFIKNTAPATRDEELAEESAEALNNHNNHPLEGTSILEALTAFAKSHRVWLMVIMMMLLTCLMAFLDFVSLYLMEVYHLTPSEAAMTSSIFPLGSLGGLTLCMFFYDRFSKKTLITVLTGSLIIATGCVVLLKFLPGFGLEDSLNFYVAMFAIFLFGLSASPAYFIPMSIFSIEFGGPHGAMLISLLDAFGFAGSASFGFIGGRLADSSGGWDSFMNMVIIIVVISCFSVWAFTRSDFKAMHKE